MNAARKDAAKHAHAPSHKEEPKPRMVRNDHPIHRCLQRCGKHSAQLCANSHTPGTPQTHVCAACLDELNTNR